MKKGKKIALIIFLVIFVLICAFVILSVVCSNNNKKEQSNKETIYNEEGTKKALLLYQDSLMGLTKNIVKETATLMSSDGYSVTVNHPRADLTYKTSDYDVVILITPVYAKKVATPIIEYAKNNDFSSNSVLVVITGQMLNEDKEINEVKESVNNPREIKGIKINKISEEYKTFLKD